ncbi:MAG TPA: HAMP domain-containing sensor histidine kinase [Chloroflexota bacterium]|jgi:signal transduction histidine kinase
MTLTPRGLALANSLIIFVAVALFALVAVPLRSAVMLRAMDAQLQDMGDRVAQTASTGAAVPNDVFSPHPVFVQSVTLDGVVVNRSANIGAAQLPLDPESLTRARSGNDQTSFVTFEVEGHQLRTYVRPVHSNAAQPESSIVGVLEVASPADDALPRGPVLGALIAGILVGGIGVLAVGWLLARVALAPVEHLAATVDSIGSADDLSRRVPVDELKFGRVKLDPVVRLTYAFNAMLDRLELSTHQLAQSLELQRQFVGDASHQLRTPLTALTGNVHLLTRMCAEDCPVPALEEHQEILTDLNADAERMARLVSGLLLLARADAQQHLVRQPMGLERAVEEACRTARSVSDSVSIELGDMPADVQVLADADRLAQLFTILLENAVLYSPPGSQVAVRGALETRHDRRGVTVEVADSGPGVPVAERERIFERFYRSRSAQQKTEGVGLGLAIARWIAVEHEAEISVHDNHPEGSVFKAWLPTHPM